MVAPRFVLPSEVYPVPGIPGAAGFGNDVISAIMQAAVSPQAPSPRAMVSQIGPLAGGEPTPRLFPVVEPNPSGPGLVTTPAEATPGPMGTNAPARPRLLAGKAGDFMTDLAGGFGSFDWRAPPGAAFAQGFAGSIGADRARQRAAAAAAAEAEDRQYRRSRESRADQFAIEDRQYQRGRDARADARAERTDARAERTAESNALIQATRAAAEYRRATRPSKLGAAQIAQAFEMAYRANGLTSDEALSTMPDDERVARTRAANEQAAQIIKAMEAQIGDGDRVDLTTETEEPQSRGWTGPPSPHITGLGTREYPYEGITTEEQYQALPSGAVFLDENGDLLVKP